MNVSVYRSNGLNAVRGQANVWTANANANHTDLRHRCQLSASSEKLPYWRKRVAEQSIVASRRGIL